MTPFEVVLQTWGESKALAPVLLPLQELLANRLAAAGFESLDSWQVSSHTLLDGELLKTLAVQQYSLPERVFPFFVETALLVYGGSDLGKSYVQARVYTDAGEPGRAGSLYRLKQMHLTRNGAFGSVQAWQSALQTAWASLDMTEVDHLADVLLAQLEHVTTP